jgi:tetratricopeptide (TPR) repeat protein
MKTKPVPDTGAAGRWTVIWGFIVALTIAALTFSPALDGPFVFDDFHLPFADPNAAQMPPAFWIGAVRPLLMATYWANYRVSGVQPVSYHTVNIVLHAIAAVLVWLVLKKLILISPAGSSARWFPFFGAGVFLVHPLQTESVDYIAGRSEILCALFVLSGWLLFLNAFEEKTTLARTAAILLCGAGAVLSKESGICLAGLVVVTDVYFRKDNIFQHLRKRIVFYSLAGISVCIVAAAILHSLARSATAGFSSGVKPLEYALTECHAIAIYFRMFLVPVGQNVDWQLPLYHSPRDPYAWLYLGFFASLMAVIAGLYSRARLVSFGLLVALLALAPTSSFVPVQDALAERRMYLPIIGLSTALASGVMIISGRIPGAARLRRSIAFGFLLALAALSYSRSLVWVKDTALWRDSLSKQPNNARAHSNLGASLMLIHDCAGAAIEYKSIEEMKGMDEITGLGLGSAYECSGQGDLALAAYRRLVAVHPAAEAYVRIGRLEGLHDHATESLAALGMAIHLDPNNATAYAFRGIARYVLHDIPAAKDDLRHALAIDPSNAVASTWLAKMPEDH